MPLFFTWIWIVSLADFKLNWWCKFAFLLIFSDFYSKESAFTILFGFVFEFIGAKFQKNLFCPRRLSLSKINIQTIYLYLICGLQNTWLGKWPSGLDRTPHWNPRHAMKSTIPSRATWKSEFGTMSWRGKKTSTSTCLCRGIGRLGTSSLSPKRKRLERELRTILITDVFQVYILNFFVCWIRDFFPKFLLKFFQNFY